MLRFSTNNLICLILMVVLSLSLSARAEPKNPISYEDPWQPFNKAVFEFNDALDTHALKPIAKGYNAITPVPVQQGITNIFSNLGEVSNTLNATLQLEGRDALTSLTRFTINSTVGLLGIFDVASTLGLEKKRKDFGMTLAIWGVPSGPYVVLPFLGPRTLRGTVGLIPDTYSDPILYVNPELSQWSARGAKIINTRGQLLKSEDLILGDRYTFIRDIYLQNREFVITGNPPEDDF